MYHQVFSYSRISQITVTLNYWEARESSFDNAGGSCERYAEVISESDCVCVYFCLSTRYQLWCFYQHNQPVIRAWFQHPGWINSDVSKVKAIECSQLSWSIEDRAFGRMTKTRRIVFIYPFCKLSIRGNIDRLTEQTPRQGMKYLILFQKYKSLYFNI